MIRTVSRRMMTFIAALCLVLLPVHSISVNAKDKPPPVIWSCMGLVRHLPFSEAIQKAGTYYGLPIGMMPAIAWQESRWNVHSPPSHSGALGPMQVMPSTVATILHGHRFTIAQLAVIQSYLGSNLAYNICWSAKILHMLGAGEGIYSTKIAPEGCMWEAHCIYAGYYAGGKAMEYVINVSHLARLYAAQLSDEYSKPTAVTVVNQP